MNYSEIRPHLPNILIIGAEKAGTTSLFYYLAQHPEIDACAIKETYLLSQHGRDTDYWSYAANQKRGLTRLSDYKKLFSSSGSSGRLRLEACPLYLYDYEHTIDNIKRIYGESCRELLVIACIRDPIDRILSSYSMKRRDGTETLSLEEALKDETVQTRLQSNRHYSYDYLGVSLYAQSLAAYAGAFPKFVAIPYEDLQSNAAEVCSRIIQAAGLPEFAIDASQQYNMSGQPKSYLHKAVAEFLYKPNTFKRVFLTLFPYLRRLKKYKYGLGKYLFNKRSKESIQIPQAVQERISADQAQTTEVLRMLTRDNGAANH